MAEGKFITYLRVSTQRQSKSGLGLEAQRAAVAAYLNGGSWVTPGEFVEIESGKNNARPQLAKAMEMCRLTGAKLLIAKLDRLSRNAAFLLSLRDAGIEFVAADMPDASRMTVGIMAVMAEHEREMISRRTKEALAAAKARGQKLGRPSGSNGPFVDPALGRAARTAKADKFARLVGPIVTRFDLQGLSLREIAASLTEMRVKTARGGAQWTACGVRAILLRLDAEDRQSCGLA